MTVTVEFDRGTLLVRGLPRGKPDSEMPVLWDARVEAYRARAVDHLKLRRGLSSLRSARWIDDRVLPRPPEQLPSGFRSVELRPYQEAACDASRS